MKNLRAKTSVLSALSLIAVGFSGISWGHTVDAGQSLAASNILNADVYSVSCYTSGANVPQRFVGQATKTGTEATAKLRISVGRVSTVATGASATSTAAVGAVTGWAQVAAINGSTHVAVVGHDKAVLNTYTADLHCEAAAPGASPNPGTPSVEAGTTISGGTSSGGGAPIINQ